MDTHECVNCIGKEITLKVCLGHKSSLGENLHSRFSHETEMWEVC